MESYSIASNLPHQGPKNYVFVDEHNRHKRLKVMRACEGCRRRKIRCDSATTNTWPCAACTRLKLHCVPPAGGIDDDGSAGSIGSDPTIDLSQSVNFANQPYPGAFPPDPAQSFEAYNHYDGTFQKPAYYQSDDSYHDAYSDQQQFQNLSVEAYQASRPKLPGARSDSDAQQSQSSGTPLEQYKVEDLSQHLGDLQIDAAGVAPYVRQQRKDGPEPDGPRRELQEAAEDKVERAFKTDAGSHIRIPPALMPSEEDAMNLFDVFFRDVHPYAPVLNRTQFYHQWHTDKESISPLVLEAVFACAGRVADDPSEGAQWLALANKHEAYFLDTPRLSTLQALLLLLKAREGAPKRGYYYRSWMAIKTIVSMAKDLDLEDHHEIHSNGDDCGSDPAECLMKTRVWQTAFICEMMVGGPQGRADMGADPNSVDISPEPPNSDIDPFEKAISRQFVFFLRNARNIRLIADVARKAAKKRDAVLAKDIMAYNVSFHRWPDDIPADLDISIPTDGSLPKLESHFIANMHSHYHLGVVMLRRPQLQASDKFAEDPAWREHMSVCYRSSKILCLLQEAIIAQYGLTGLHCMQRGISFTIYAVLTCVMIHLVAITAPDPEWHAGARDYFVRQMRILELCVEEWSVPETVAQINGLRAAFSADLNKPFELKSSFPLGSPETHQPSPPQSTLPNGLSTIPQQQQQQQQHHQQQSHPLPQQQIFIPPTQPYATQQMSHIQQSSYLATPPVSAVSADSKPHSPHFQQAYDMNQQASYIPTSTYFQQQTPTETPAWNPTPIMDQFTTAFAIPPSALGPPPTYGSPTGQGYPNQSPPYPNPAAYPPGQAHMQQPSSQARQQFYQRQHQPQPPYIDTSSAALHHAAQQQQQHQHQHQQQQQMHAQAQAQAQLQTPQSGNVAGGNSYVPAPQGVFVTPKEWQQSVASVFDPGALKRRWDGVE